MTTTLIAALFGIAFISTVVTTPVAKWFGQKLGLVDHPDDYRKVHRQAIPLGGGFAVFLGFVIPIVYFFQSTDQRSELPPSALQMTVMLIVGGSMAMLMGLADDLRNLKARWKIVFQILAASLAYLGGFRIEAISNPLGETVDIGLLSFFVTLLWFLVCINALNLVDGLDGLSAGIGLIVTLTLLGVSINADNKMGIFLNACLSGALLGFLLFNFNPASIFLGDSGSMLIGFLVAAISLLTKNKAETATALLIPLMALGLPIYDMALAVVRRWSQRIPISVADRRHIHHRLLLLGFSHREAVVMLYGISIILCLASVIMILTRNQYSTLIVLLLGMSLIVGTRVLKLVDFSELQRRLQQDHDEHIWRKAATLQVERAIQRCGRAETVDLLWEALVPSFSSLQMGSVKLELTTPGGDRSWKWAAKDPGSSEVMGANHDTWQFNLGMQKESCDYGSIQFCQHSLNGRVRNTTLFVDRLRKAATDRLHELMSKRIPN